ncbi:ribbon-helix-helix domain-containing protein [Candidatus Peregrinibacteria bacterium]|nr:ribbon-helix-helix domain-containing protein [Candidatus Peregrinibacteria bacterium]
MKTLKTVKRRISITILPIIDDSLAKLSEQEDVSKSALVEKAIREFLQNKLDEDTKTLSQIKFDDLPSEDEWLTVQSV